MNNSRKSPYRLPSERGLIAEVRALVYERALLRQQFERFPGHNTALAIAELTRRLERIRRQLIAEGDSSERMVLPASTRKTRQSRVPLVDNRIDPVQVDAPRVNARVWADSEHNETMERRARKLRRKERKRMKRRGL